MRRFLAVVALIAVSSAGSLQAWCEQRCANESTTGDVALSHCHEDAGESNGPTFGSTETCGDHAVAPALPSATNTSVSSNTAPQALPVELFSGVARLADQYVASFAIDTSPPLPTKITVLRV